MKLIVDVVGDKRKYSGDGSLVITDYTRHFNNHITNVILDADKKRMIIEFGQDLRLEVLNDLAFEQLGDYLDLEFGNLKSRVLSFIQTKRPQVNKPKCKPINRNRSRSMSPKLVIGAISLSALVIISGFNYKNMEHKDNNNDTINPDISYSQIIEKPEEEPVVIPLDFENRYNQGKVQEINEAFGDTIKYFSDRYGLPYELVSAQIAQESVNLSSGDTSNLCQIETSQHLNENMTIPVYNENGFTGEYDNFIITEELISNPTTNIMICVAYDRMNVDKYNSLLSGIFSYNQGINALSNACEFYGLDVNNYKGDENTLAAVNLVVKYYNEGLQKEHADKEYLEHVLSYLDTENRGSKDLKYYVGETLKSIKIENQRELSSGVGLR